MSDTTDDDSSTAAGFIIFIPNLTPMLHPDYTQRARRFVHRYPVFNIILTQTGFWVMANIILALLLHLMYSSVHVNMPLPLPPELWPTMITGIILGILYGLVLGITEYFLEKQFFRRRSLGVTFLLKSVVSLLTLVLLVALKGRKEAVELVSVEEKEALK